MSLNNRPSNRKGFTLVELVVVLVILGILAAIALPRYRDFTGQANTARANGNADQVSLRFNTLMAQAAATNPANAYPTLGSLVGSSGAITPTGPSGWSYDATSGLFYDPAVNSAPGATSTASTCSYSIYTCGQTFNLSGTISSVSSQVINYCIQNYAYTIGGSALGDYQNDCSFGLQNQYWAGMIFGTLLTPAVQAKPAINPASPPSFPNDGVCSYTYSAGVFGPNAQDPDCSNAANPISCPSGATQSGSSCAPSATLQLALDGSGVCVGPGLKAATWKDLGRSVKSTSSSDLIKQVDAAPVSDATNCPSSMFK